MFRYIDCSIWADPDFEAQEPDAKLLWIYLFTNLATTLCGIYRITPRRISFDTGIEATRVSQILAEMQEAKSIAYDGEEICVFNFIKRQANRSPKVWANIRAELAKVKNKDFAEIIKTKYKIGDKYPTDTKPAKERKGEERKEKKEKKAKKEDAPAERPAASVISDKTPLAATEPANPKTKPEQLDYLVMEIESSLFPVTAKERLKALQKKYSFEQLKQTVVRCSLYFKEVKKNKWKRYVFAKRFSKFIENIEVFVSDEALQERLDLIKKWNNDPERGSRNASLLIGAPREIPKPLSDEEMLHAALEDTERAIAVKKNYLDQFEGFTEEQLDPPTWKKIAWHKKEMAELENDKQGILKQIKDFEAGEQKAAASA